MENPIFTGMQPGLYMKIIKSNMILIEFTTMFFIQCICAKAEYYAEYSLFGAGGRRYTTKMKIWRLL